MKLSEIKKAGGLITGALLVLAIGTQPASAQERQREDRQRSPDRQQPNDRNRPDQHNPGNNNRPPSTNRPPSQGRPPSTNRPPSQGRPPADNRPPSQGRPPIVNRPPQYNRPPGNNRPQTGRYPSNRPSFSYRPRGWSQSRRAYSRPPVVYGGRRYYSYHRYYSHPYTPYFYGPNWHPAGFFISSLATAAILITLENRRYNYYDGVFYEPYNNGYQVVPPPMGAYIPSIPEGFQQVMVGGINYYYFGGAFYIQDGGGNYQVVASPAGAVIYNLPEGATTEQVDNYTYLLYNGNYYQPIQINGQNAYEVVELEDDNQ